MAIISMSAFMMQALWLTNESIGFGRRALITSRKVGNMKVFTVKMLETDKKEFEQALLEDRQKLVDAQEVILRIEGALVYINQCIETLKTAAIEAEKDKVQEVKDAVTS